LPEKGKKLVLARAAESFFRHGTDEKEQDLGRLKQA